MGSCKDKTLVKLFAVLQPQQQKILKSSNFQSLNLDAGHVFVHIQIPESLKSQKVK